MCCFWSNVENIPYTQDFSLFYLYMWLPSFHVLRSPLHNPCMLSSISLIQEHSHDDITYSDHYAHIGDSSITTHGLKHFNYFIHYNNKTVGKKEQWISGNVSVKGFTHDHCIFHFQQMFTGSFLKICFQGHLLINSPVPSFPWYSVISINAIHNVYTSSGSSFSYRSSPALFQCLP